MTVRPCTTHVTGCPCISDDPFANFSSEAPDPISFLRMSWNQTIPGINSPENFYDNPIGLGTCTDVDPVVAQDCANGQAFIDSHLDQPVFRSHLTSCSVPCPDGSFFFYSLAAGAVTASTQAMADYLAQSICLYRATLARRCAPSVTTGAASDIDDVNATLNGTVNPNGAATTAFFEWGEDTSYGNITPITDVGAGRTTLNFFALLTGLLLPGTTYHFRIVAISSQGTAVGADSSFVTVNNLAPLAWWKMEENGAGNRIDIIGGATLVPAGANGTVSRVAGKVNFGVDLAGNAAPFFIIDKFLNSGAATFPYVKADGIDITLWFNDSTFVNGQADIIDFFSPSNGPIRLFLTSTLGLTLDVPFVSSVSAPWVFGAGWSFIRVFIDDDAGVIGFQVNTNPPVTMPYVEPADGNTSIYQLAVTTDDFTLASNVACFWDEVAIWPRLLTAAEITTLYNGGAGHTWPF